MNPDPNTKSRVISEIITALTSGNGSQRRHMVSAAFSNYTAALAEARIALSQFQIVLIPVATTDPEHLAQLTVEDRVAVVSLVDQMNGIYTVSEHTTAALLKLRSLVAGIFERVGVAPATARQLASELMLP